MRGRSSSQGDYDTVEEKYLATKNEETVRALLRGIKTEAEARKYLGAINKLGIEDWRRDWVLEYLGEG